LPDKLPASLEIDISNLKEFGQELTVANITLSSDIVALAEPTTVIVSLLAPSAEPEVAPEVEATPEGAPAEGQAPFSEKAE
jgi:hypothetical protein